MRDLGGHDLFMTRLKRVLDPPFDFHIEYVEPLHRKSETASEWLMYNFVL